MSNEYAHVMVYQLSALSFSPGDSTAVADASRGVRSIQFSPEGRHLAVGDRQGNLRFV